MKKHVYFWLVMFLAISLCLPIYSMAEMTLTLEDSTGNRIYTPGISSFAVGTDNNLIIYLSQPFTFKDLIPDILLSSCASCEITGPADVTVTQGYNLSFNVQSNSTSAVISLEASSAEIGPRTLVSANGSAPFSWNTGATTPPTPTGSYIAVFQALDGSLKSQLPVTINVVPPGHTLTINATNGSVTKSPDQVTYTISPVQSVTLTAVAASGYYFTSWSGDASGNTNPTTIQMNGNKTVTASFTQTPSPQYAVTTTANPAGAAATLTGAGFYVAGASVTVATTAGNGYTFSNWTENSSAVSTSASYQFIMPSNGRSLVANFTANTPPPGQGTLGTIAYADWYGMQTDSYSAGQVKTYVLPITNLTTNHNITRLKVMTAGLINYGDVGIKLISPSGASWTSDANGTSDETIELRSQSSWFANYPGQYIEWGDWTLEITAHMASGIRIWWNFFL